MTAATVTLPTRPDYPRVTGGYFHDRPVPPEWAARLAEVSPYSASTGFLRLYWEPGDIWRPVQRWMIGEALDPTSPAIVDAIDPYEMLELNGPHPRSEGHICTSVPLSSWATRPPKGYRPCLCRRKTEAWRRGPCSRVTLTQWKFYRETGYVMRPFWVIQGRNGGHKLFFTDEEQQMLSLEGYPTDPPAPGALDYTDFDGRVVKQIVQFNRLWQFRNNLMQYREAMGPGYAKHRSESEKALRAQLVGHLKEQMQESQDLFLRAMNNGEMDGEARTNIDYDRLAPQSEAHFIETGRVLHHSEAT